MYTINEVAVICDLSVHTLRYYDKEGLLPFISRNKSGNREFTEQSLGLIKIICCLKNTGMPIKHIKQYVDLCMVGETKVDDRKKMLVEHRREVAKQMDEMRKNLNIIDLKIALYEKGDQHEFAHHLEPARSE
ncbi:MerR family transcriptional regulator [Paenibacillus pectinilyticus]|uniref:MerR family transcriptional regulator n=1 Tax=Paenibacillus pectinilyticus TaxID=512399 RepID=A0A1C0ZZA0_9BACL|nr:MerR family transcriptional regulator [Paenibacillus pectinilyticus]OCT13462.1 MerR family transcriptional regulator [Paenibacillus pectinilyticus]